MGWPEKTQFKAAERLPVPPEVHTAFKKLQSAEIGQAYRSSGFSKSRAPLTKESYAPVQKAISKVDVARAEAATHFGGDAGKMSTHYKRWTRWKGTAMSPAGLAEEVIGRTLKNIGADEEPMYEKMQASKRLTKPTRRNRERA